MCVNIPAPWFAYGRPGIFFIVISHIFGRRVGEMLVCQNLVPLVNIKIAGKWMFFPLKMVLIGIDGIDPYPNHLTSHLVALHEMLRILGSQPPKKSCRQAATGKHG
jgi:hypothetical protein